MARAFALPVLALLVLATVPAAGGQAAFDATFKPKPGNSWWVEADVTANQALAGVDARANGGPWVALAKQSWGSWAKSFNVPDGSSVEFRARSTSGATDQSGAYRWPQATPIEQPPPASTTFDHRGGNEWWVEMRLTGSYPVHVVHVEESDGDAKELKLNQWGNWVGSLHIEPGHQVRFTASAQDGRPAERSCWFTHPAGKAPTGGETCPGTPVSPEAADVAFGPKAGNAWWVETFALGGGQVSTVEARANGGPWKPLRFQPWGTWAGSFNVPDGSHVEFRATTPRGSDVSMPFLWPRAIPLSSEGTWPEEGSYVDYDLDQGVAGDRNQWWDATFVFHAGAWRFQCSGTSFGSPTFSTGAAAPPFGDLFVHEDGAPRPVAVGDRVMVRSFFACMAGDDEVPVGEEHVHATRNDGKTVQARYWYGVTDDDGCGGCNYHAYDWDKRTGLVAFFHDGGTGWSTGELQDTDAPLQT